MSIKNDGHYFCGAGGNRPDGSDEALTCGLATAKVQREIKRGFQWGTKSAGQGATGKRALQAHQKNLRLCRRIFICDVYDMLITLLRNGISYLLHVSFY
ncbi:hypothetical protein S716_004843 [Salmonella enterica subsp. enterica]|nr:hypothetical protein [Salmonella enterica]EDP9049238.1 hypothetical protein [Salmonella enterica subsp. enterica serovar Abony]EEJ0783905.1 hypothetical protein [Salmonella enterica]